MRVISLLVLCAAGALQMDPEATTAAVNRELERFQREYLRQNSLEPSADELAGLRSRMPSAREGAEGRERDISEKFTYSLAANFKLQRDLYRKHGGRIVLSAFGFHVASDAMIAELASWEKQGKWQYPADSVRVELLRYLRSMRGDGVVEGAKAKEIFARPIWSSPAK